MSWKRHLVPVPQGEKLRAAIERLETQQNSQSLGGSSSNFTSYIPEVYAGPTNRIERYQQYNNMDRDPEINSALDTIADFCTQTEETEETPFNIKYLEEASDAEVEVLNQTLKSWCKVNKWKKRIWRAMRNVIVYGDQFFVRDPETFELLWLNHEKIEHIIVNEAEGKEPDQYVVKEMDLNIEAALATAPTKNSNRGFSAWAGMTSRDPGPVSPTMTAGSSGLSRFSIGESSSVIDAEHVIHLSLSEGLDSNWPFGNSILEAVFKPYKQKELLEDAILIYRVQRAPERRIFHIDVGNAPPHKAMEYVNRIKNEIHQRRIPSQTGGGQCFSLDTLIPLLDGRTLSLSDIITEFKAGKKLWAYSCNPATGKMVPGPITWAGVTRKNTDVIKLTLDNGKEIICTPDHKFPIKNKGTVEAKDIEENDSFYSFNTKVSSINERNDNGPKYQMIYNHETNNWEFTHRAVAKFMKAQNKHNELIYERLDSYNKKVIHHNDYDKYNNSPENLYFMDPYDHFLLHSKESKRMWEAFSEDKKMELGKKRSKLIKEAWKNRKNNSEEYNAYLKKISTNIKKYIKDNPEHKALITSNLTEMHKPFPNQHVKFNERMLEIMEKVVLDKYSDESNICNLLSSNKEFMDEYRKLNTHESGKYNRLNYNYFSPDTFRKMIKNAGYKSWSDYLKTKIGITIKKPSKRIKWHDMQLNILVNQTKLGVTEIKECVNCLNNNPDFMRYYKTLNSGIKGNASHNKISNNTLNVMLNHFGYKSWTDFKSKVDLYNHKIVKIEYLEEKIDTGTITIDGNEEFHDYHTFALDSGVYTFNSVMDAAYNPLSIIEDFFFPKSADGRGSEVTTLPGGECLTLDTSIKLLDGRELELYDIIEEFNQGKQNWVYSVNPETGEIVPGPITWAGITRRYAELVQVTLDNGEKIRCTPDHEFLLKEGIYVESKDLKQNQLLMSYENPLTVVSVEYLPYKEDTGDITIDGNEEFHDYHNFAISAGIFISNSVGEIDDLKYFNNKMLRGLSVPPSYLPFGPDDSTALSLNDGRMGQAYMQEFRFAKRCKRLQNMINESLDREFKIYCRHKGIQIEASLFEIELHEPQNFSKYRQIEIDAAQIGVFQPLADVKYFSKRFLMKRYLQMSEDEIVENEQMWKEENPDVVKAIEGDSGLAGAAQGVGLGDVGIRPESGDMDVDDLAGDIGDETGMTDDSPISGTEDEMAPDTGGGDEEGGLEI